jgi:2-dehydropantoate 2-reductase
MKIAIIGSGGVGGYFGAKLAKAGNNVVFFARGAHLKAMQQYGLEIKSINESFKIENIHATDDMESIGIVDLVIVGVKAWQLKDVAGRLNALVGPQTVVLPLQNGVLAVDELRAELPEKNVIAGLCRIISKIEAPGVINHFGVEPVIILGESDNSQSERLFRLKEVFENSGIKCQIPRDIHVELWKKFITICVSGLLAVSKTTYGELREITETRQMMIDLFNEVYNLALAQGIQVREDFVEKTVAFIDTFPYDTTSSLTRDVLEGKPSELEYQNGTVVKLGKKYGVETPVNSFVYGCILPMEMKARNI